MERITRLTPTSKDTPLPEHNCDACRHFCRVNSQEECHRNPPMAAMMMGPQGPAGAAGYWPPITKDPAGRFCGEWQARPIHQNA